MSQPDAPHQCPRCGSRDCSNPDDKACSDNCITRLHAEVATLREQRDALAKGGVEWMWLQKATEARKDRHEAAVEKAVRSAVRQAPGRAGR